MPRTNSVFATETELLLRNTLFCHAKALIFPDREPIFRMRFLQNYSFRNCCHRTIPVPDFDRDSDIHPEYSFRNCRLTGSSIIMSA